MLRLALAAAALCAWAGLQAAPINAQGSITTRPGAADESPQAAEFRAGLQAQIKGDRARARQHFDAALKIDPRHAPALLGLAGLAQAEGRVAEIEPLLRRAEQAAPKAPEVQLAWGRHFLATRRPDEAEKAFLAARSLAPQAMPLLIELGDLYLALPGRAADALAVYRAAVKLDAGNPFAQYGLGAAAAVAGQRDEALGAFGRAAELAPKDPAPLRAMGRLHLEAGALKEALVAFDRGLQRQPDFVLLMLDRADALARQARWADALAQLQAAQKRAPQSAEVRVKIGDVLQATDRWVDAEKNYLEAIELAPKSPIAYNNLAWMTVARGGDAARALDWARKAVALSPQSSPFHDTLGWAERAAGNHAAAAASLTKAIGLEPQVSGYHLHLGIVQSELKQTAAARASLQRALELEPQGAQADATRKRLAALPG